MARKVAIVTGSNKGIGFAIVRGLCKRFEGDVYLTARNEALGKKAVSDLKGEGLNPLFHQLDISKTKSVETFRDFIKEKYEGIDVLVNNAAIAFKDAATEPAEVQVEQTISVNYFATLSTCRTLFPLLKNGARVVNVSSSCGQLINIPSLALRNEFKNPELTTTTLSDLMNRYVEAAKKGNQVAEWGNSSYVVSKLGVIALTKIQQRELDGKGIKVNAVHPGYVATDMSSYQGDLTIDEGAAAPLYLALDAPDNIKGELIWFDKTIAGWDGEETC